MIPLSFAQRRLWFLHRLEGPSATYNVPFVLRLRGALDTAALEAAVRDVLGRHESLRTVFVEDEHGGACQRVVPVAAVPLTVPVADVAPEEVPGAVAQAVSHRFDLTAEIPVRASVLRCAPQEHVLVLVAHHIACDRESAGPLLRDLGAAYEARRGGGAPGWDELPVRYQDYTVWQRDLLGGEDGPGGQGRPRDPGDPGALAAAQVAYWRQELADVPQPLTLPSDRPRPGSASHRGEVYEFPVEPDLLTSVEKLAADHGAGVSTAMQSALAVLLHQLGAGEDITIGSPLAGRTVEALTDLVGFFTNTWVLRLDLSKNPSFSDLLATARTKTLTAYDHHDVPFERLVELLDPERSTAHHPLFQVMYAWQTDLPGVEIPGLQATFEPAATGTARFDLFFDMTPDTAGGARVRLEYATDLFDRGTIEAIADRFLRVLRQVVTDPGLRMGAVDLLDDEERGRLLRNADGTAPPGDLRTYVLGAGLAPVPAGVVGELYVAGAAGGGSLGRGAPTAERFVADPFGPPGRRMYRTGDLARWNREGRLEHAGRADARLKVRGLRIAPAEIEAVLMAHPGVARAVVVAREGRSGGGKRLVAHIVPGDGRSGDGGGAGEFGSRSGLSTAELRRFAAARLPEYLVPSAFTLLGELPLTANGEPDREALPGPDPAEGVHRAPRTPAEEALAEAFADVLGLDRVGVDDDFFVAGGDSIRSVQVAARARARGIELTAREVIEHRTVAELAVLTAGRTGTTPALAELEGGGTGWMPLLPAARRLLARSGGSDRYATAQLLELPPDIHRSGLMATLGAVLDRHDLLRARLVQDPEPGLRVQAPGLVHAESLVRRVHCDGACAARLLDEELDAAAGRLDPAAGTMAQFVWFDPSAIGTGGTGRLLVVLHHLVADGVSWRILLPDLAEAWAQVRDGDIPALPPVGTSVRRWAHALEEAAQGPARVRELAVWREVLEGGDPVLGSRLPDPDVDVMSTVRTVRVRVPAAVTEPLLTGVPTDLRGGADDLLVTGLALALARRRQSAGNSRTDALLRLEGHGREEDAVPGADLSRTLGRFNGTFPARVDVSGIDLDEALAGGPAAGRALDTVTEQLRTLPGRGIGYGLLRHLNPDTAGQLAGYPDPQIGFTYHRHFSAADMPIATRGLGWVPAADAGELTPAPDADMPALSALEVHAVARDGEAGTELTAYFGYPEGVLTEADVTELADLWVRALAGLAAHLRRPGAGGPAPSGLPQVRAGRPGTPAAPTRRRRLRLYCLPYAGGSARRIYGGWQRRLPAHIEVVPLELPGRGARIRERPVPRVDGLVADVVQQILPWREGPFALFGHSLGGLLAFEAARVLQHRHGLTARGLLVSGTPAPDGRVPSGGEFLLPDREFKERIRDLDGTPPQVLENEELMGLFLPVLRADFAAAARWRHRQAPPLDSPLTVFGGTRDAEVAAGGLTGWSRQTTASCEVRLLPGGHFFIDEAPELLLPLVADRLDGAPEPDAG